MAKVKMEEMVEEAVEEEVGDEYPPDDPDDHEVPDLPTGSARGRVSSSRIMAKEKQRRAMEMRKAGATFEAIAQALGYASASGAHNAVKNAMNTLIQEPAEDLRTVQYERLNHMLVMLWPKVNSGDERAIAQAQSLMRDMNELMGANLPRKTEVDVSVQGAIIVADVDSGDYIAAMQKVAAGAIVHNGMRAIGQGEPDDDTVGILDAEVVEESEPVVYEEQVTTDPPDERPVKKRRSLSLTED